jgi:hypothetical protein
LHFAGVPDTGVGCNYNLGPTALSISCTSRVARPPSWPELSNAIVTASRDESLASILGDIGGRWTVSSGNATCQAALEGNTVTLTCVNAKSYTGQVTLNVNGDRISGTTSGGIEFTAQRR